MFAGLSEIVPSALRLPATALPATGNAQLARASEPWQVASFPVEGFQAYTSPYGYRGSGFHYGIDIAAPTGSYIRNWWDGQIVEVSDDSACGTSVIVESGDWTHIYCHMQGYVTNDGGRRTFVDDGGGLRLAEGQTVLTGDRIGRVGMTGRTTGPHLHWGMRYQGDWVDPGLVLQAMADGQRQASVPGR
ncbi:MAG: putative metalloendopeptidase [Phormidesmis priestleyi Ana]|uniref:Putative metalloendopeptidase n=1 Tax=Phormidesmis priestleyi Ana TaxID=1666911 RepID=A0A0N8KNK2_9CYAN|nr:MAG: putative metalloendopeptidase [Phormidesmis priestleyi Ana]